MRAAQTDRPCIMRRLLRAGASVHLRNRDGESATDIAVRKNHVACIEAVLDIDERTRVTLDAIMAARGACCAE